jgi:transcriptional regulator with XRE-family HTH domain
MTAANDKRVDRIRKLLGCKTDIDLAARLGTNQPQISRWRHKGLPPSTTALIDSLLGVITQLIREISLLRKSAPTNAEKRKKDP